MDSRSSPAATDRVRRFIFEERPIRGHWVHLSEAWRELRAHTEYPPAVVELLGQAVAASVLLAATLKFRGTLTFQLEGNGAARLLVAQCTHDFRVRAVARSDADALCAIRPNAPEDVVFRALTGSEGRITVTVEADERRMRYQGVVPLSGDSLAESLEAYFASSEQLPTRVRLIASADSAAGILVQKLPEAASAEPEEIAEAWYGAQRGIAHLAPEALQRQNVETLLAEAFQGSDLRLFRGARVRFECRCSQGRVAGLLRALGPEEVQDVLKDQGSVTVTCEFCSRSYRFDSADVLALFSEPTSPDGSGSSGSEIIH
jgi:molecular chaperone Hsp33